MKYARTFLKEVPVPTTDLFVEYYTGRYFPGVKDTPESQAHHKNETGLQSYLNAALLQQLPYMGGGGGTTATNTPTNPTAGPTPKTGPESASGEATTVPLALPTPYRPPRPRTAFSSFVEHPKEFIIFLERVLESAEGGSGTLNESDRIDIYTTLFEIYLQRANEEEKKEEKEKWEAKAKKIIENKEVRYFANYVTQTIHYIIANNNAKGTDRYIECSPNLPSL